MKIYTSYFGNIKQLSNEGLTVISVARFSPRWYNGARYSAVAPTPYMLGGACNHEEYLKRYDDILNGLSPEVVIRDITTLSRGKDVALCCYEKPNEFCHRHLLAEWITANTSYEVKEWGVIERKEVAEEQSLF